MVSVPTQPLPRYPRRHSEQGFSVFMLCFECFVGNIYRYIRRLIETLIYLTVSFEMVYRLTHVDRSSNR